MQAASEPLDSSAAKGLLELTDLLKKNAGKDSGNERALRDIEHEAIGIERFATSIGLVYGHDGTRFEKQPEPLPIDSRR
jgi:hypothetical protein